MPKLRKSNARRTTNNPIRVYTYGIPFVSDQVQHVLDQELYQAFLYRRTLVDIERERRAQYRIIRRSLSPRMDELERLYEAAEERYREARRGLSGRNNPGKVNRQIITKKEFSTSAQALNARALRTESNSLWKLIQAERKTVEQIFDAPNAEFQRRKRARLIAYLGTKEPRLNLTGMSEVEFENLLSTTKKKAGSNNPKINEIPRLVRAEMNAEAVWPQTWKDKECNEEAAKEAARLARENKGCLSGTSLKVEDAAQRSFKDSRYDPKRPYYDHTGLVGIQLTKSDGEDCTFERIFDDSYSKIRLELVPGVQLRGYERKLRRYKRQLDNGLQADEPPQAMRAIIALGRRDKKRVLIEVPFVLHRPLPKDSVFKWAMVKCARIGLRRFYELQLHVESATFHRSGSISRAVAIRLGWRQLDNNGLQVSTFADGENVIDPLVLPPVMLGKVKFAEDLLGHSDTHFDSVKRVVAPWLKTNEREAQDAWDKWHTTRNRTAKNLKATFHAWKSHGTLAVLSFALADRYLNHDRTQKLWSRWKTERLTKRLDLYDDWLALDTWFRQQGVENLSERLALYLNWWRRKDNHLINRARSIIHKVALERREIYRREAVKLKRSYGIVVVGTWDKRKTAETPNPEDDTRTQQDEASNALRHFAGVSVFEEALHHVFGPGVVEIPIVEVPRHHHGCRQNKLVSESETDGASPHRTCPQCGHHYNHDANMARQLLATYCERSSGPQTSGTARTGANSKKDNTLRSDHEQSVGRS